MIQILLHHLAVMNYPVHNPHREDNVAMVISLMRKLNLISEQQYYKLAENKIPNETILEIHLKNEGLL